MKFVPILEASHPLGDILKLTESMKGYNWNEVYVSTIREGCVKAWKRHFFKNNYLLVIEGAVLFATTTDLAVKPDFKKLSAGERKFIVIEAGTWFGFANQSKGTSSILAFSDYPHSEADVERTSYQSVKWRFDV